VTDPQRAFFDARAEGWEERCYPPEVRAELAGLVADVAPEPRSVVLDLGAGTGVLYPYLRGAVGPAGRVVALDLSHAMLRLARRKALRARDLTVQGTALALPLADAAFDLVFCFAAFPHFADPGQALAEMARVTRPGGEVVVAHLLSRQELAAHHGGHEAVRRDLLPDDAAMRDLFGAAGLTRPVIVDRPGRYLARARR
jgi:ubiquinone/menaquinone biosynthesis C-methylase UbiE